MNRNATHLPSYDQLPVIEGAPPGSSWGCWGEHDVLGALNLLTKERISAGLATVRDNDVFSLGLPLGAIDPPLYNRPTFEHVVTDTAAGHDDYFNNWNPQSDTQWDGFRHVRHPTYGFYNGKDDLAHGMQHWADRGIVGRAVLADVGRWMESVGSPIDPFEFPPDFPDDLAATLDFQGTEVAPGDILVVRTSWLEWYRGTPPRVRAELAAAGGLELAAPGLRPGRDMARHLWDLHIAALIVDNPAVEVWPRGWPRSRDEIAEMIADPDRCEDAFLHYSLLPLLGIPIGELWDLGALAAACATDRRYEFLLVSSPLNVRGGVSSPANAVAIR